MISAIFRWFSAISAVVLVAALALFVFLVLDSGSDKDHFLKQSVSPDGKLVVELHQITTPMHGGPDTVYVAIRKSGERSGDKIYSKTFECADFSAFGVEWTSGLELTIKYGECNASGHDNPQEKIKENRVWQKDATWHNVRINYEDARHCATH